MAFYPFVCVLVFVGLLFPFLYYHRYPAYVPFEVLRVADFIAALSFLQVCTVIMSQSARKRLRLECLLPSSCSLHHLALRTRNMSLSHRWASTIYTCRKPLNKQKMESELGPQASGCPSVRIMLCDLTCCVELQMP